jgi:hypothetical protein
VEGITIMCGESFLESQETLDYILSDGATQFELALYDPYSYDANGYTES